MKYIKKALENIKTQPDIWFFYAFLLTFTLSVRKVILYFPIQGTFNEYTSIYVYISDIFLFLSIVLWIVSILYNSIDKSSSYNMWITHFVHRFSLKFKSLFRNPAIIIPSLLVVWSFVSVIWSHNQTIAFFRSLKLFEYYLLYLYIIFRIVPRLPRELFHACPVNCSTLAPLIVPRLPRGLFHVEQFLRGRTIFINIIVITGVIQSLIGIWQFIVQRSISLLWLKESIISPDIPGVAKIIINGEKYIRAYGLFPHPNILGGFLLFSIIMTLLYIRLFHACPVSCSTPAPLIVPRLPRGLFHVEQFLRGETIFTGWNNFYGVKQSDVADTPYENRSGMAVVYLALLVQGLALILTFSKSAILGLLIALIYLYVPRGTIFTRWNNLYGVEQFVRGRIFHPRWNNIKRALLAIAIIVLALVIAKPDYYSFFVKSLNERVLYLNVSRETILEHPLIGIGNGQLVANMETNSQQTLELWQFQPVHNVFLLIWSELGIIGLILFIYWLYKVFRSCPIKCSTCLIGRQAWNNYYIAVTTGFIFIMLFDHYLWDIQQGSFLLWMALGFIIDKNKEDYSILTS